MLIILIKEEHGAQKRVYKLKKKAIDSKDKCHKHAETAFIYSCVKEVSAQFLNSQLNNKDHLIASRTTDYNNNKNHLSNPKYPLYFSGPN